MEQHLNSFNKGMHQDSPKEYQPEGTYSFCLNGVNEELNQQVGFITNEKGFGEVIDLQEGDPAGPIIWRLLGQRPLNDGSCVVFLVNDTSTQAAIKVVTPNSTIDTSKLLFVDTTNAVLQFSIQYQIKAEYKINAEGHRVVYFTDDLNPVRYVDIDDVTTPTYDSLQLFPNYNFPIIIPKYITDTGGFAVKTGTYQFAVRYSDEEGNTTGWSDLCNPITVIEQSYFTLNLNDIEGSNSGIVTSKAIGLQIVNVDTDFPFYEIGVLYWENNIPSAAQLKRVKIGSTSEDFIYRGLSSDDFTIDPNELIVDPIVYSSAKTITQSRNRLVLGNVKERPIYNYQPFANDIQVRYKIFKHSSQNVFYSYKYGITNSRYKTFTRDEVYALGIVLIYKDGTQSPVYHIPGRAKDVKADGTAFVVGNNIMYTHGTYGTNMRHARDVLNAPVYATWDSESYTVVAPSENIIDPGTPQERWQVFNTAMRTNFDPTCDLGGLYAEGELSYWESTEDYPNGVDYPNTLGVPDKIRHHKMPDIQCEPLFESIAEGAINGRTPTQVDYDAYYYSLSLDISNVIIPDDLKDQIQGIKIVVGKREKDNDKSIIGKGLMTRQTQYTVGATPLNSFVPPLAAGDTPMIQTYPGYENRPTTFPAPTRTESDSAFCLFSPDLMFDNSSLLSAYQIKLEECLQTKLVGTGTVGNQPVTIAGTTYPDGYVVELDYLNNNLHTSVIAAQLWYNRKIVNALNIDMDGVITAPVGNTLNNRYDNRKQQPAVYLQLLQNPSYIATIPANIPTTLETYSARATYGDILQYAAMWHVSIKRYLPAQYGTLDDIEYEDTGSYCLNPTYGISDEITNLNNIVDDGTQAATIFTDYDQTLTSLNLIVYGGDSYVVRYGFKRSFLQPYYDSFGIPTAQFSIYEWSTNYFYTEGTINTTLRQSRPNVVYADGEFFPHCLTEPLASIYTDTLSQFVITDILSPTSEVRLYNEDFNIKNDFSLSYNVPDWFTQGFSIYDFPTRIIWSEKSYQEDRQDKYRVFKANNYYDLPKHKGELWNLFVKDDIMFAHTQHTLFRTFNEEQSIQTSATDTYLGAGEFFGIDPRELVSVETGYAGTMSQYASTTTQYGHFFPDILRGRVFLLGEGIEEISKIGMESFFRQNMRLKGIDQINAYLASVGDPLLDLQWYDNPANPSGFGYVATFDQLHKRYILTKRDYEFIDPTLFVGYYDPIAVYTDGTYVLLNGQVWVMIAGNPEPVDFDDPDQFINRSWTASFSMINKAWISFHSYLPTNAYSIYDRVFFKQNANNSYIWEGNVGDRGFYFNDLYDFVIENISNPYPANTKVFDAVELDFEVWDINGGSMDFFFDRGIFYNNYQATGEMIFSLGLDVVRKERRYRFSEYRDLVDVYTSPFFTELWNNPIATSNYPIDKELIVSNIDTTKPWYEQGRFRDKYLAQRWIWDNGSNYKLMLKFVNTSYRISPR